MALTRAHWIAAGAAILPLAAASLYLGLSYDSLPDRYPTHWNFRGVADAYKPKSGSTVFAVPLIGVFSFIITLAAMGSQAGDPDNPKSPSPLLLIFTCWFLTLLMSAVAILPALNPDGGHPWFIPATLAGTAGVVAIGIRDSRRRKS